MRWPEHRRRFQPSAGFTLIELLVVITIIGILAAIALPNYIKAKDKAKEVQMKSACHAIQIAVERYHTDFEQYPQFLLGGDDGGWKNFHTRFDEANPATGVPQNAWIRDILLDYNYLDTYPANPFVDNGKSVIAQTGPVNPPASGYSAGDGDPRFGFQGNIMGNGLDVPQLFRNWFGNTDLNIETERTLNCSTGGNAAAKGFGTPLGANPGLHYMFGGRRGSWSPGTGSFTPVFTHWPGNFFYRGVGIKWITRKGYTVYVPQTFVKAEIDRYMLGGYGSYTTAGKDVARLEKQDPHGQQVYYQLPPPWAPNAGAIALDYNCPGASQGGLPEIFGGGSDTEGPFYPYDQNPDFPMSFIYGSPDGIPDAVILVLTAGEDVTAYN